LTARTHHCRACTRAARHPTRTRQVFTHSENGKGRAVENWRCTVCGLALLTMADVPDADGMCLNAIAKHRRKLDLGPAWAEEMFLQLRLDMLAHFRQKWRPDLCPSFRAYAATALHNAIIDHERRDKGRDVPKAHVGADSLNAPLGKGDSDVTLLDRLAAEGDNGLDALDSLINVAGLRPRQRRFHERVMLPLHEQELKIDEAAALVGWTRSQFMRERDVYYDAVRQQAVA
jgi:hypothetical protein